MSKPEVYGEDEVTCPYCGYETTDSWELQDYGTSTCVDCDKKYSWQRDVLITYSSEGVDG